MDYHKVHDNIINRAKNRNYPQGVYGENHHVIPKCMGGSNDKANIVRLTAREHFIIHWLLYRMYQKNVKLAIAFFRCAKINYMDRGFIPSSRSYEEARIAQSIAISKINKGRVVSERELANHKKANQMFRGKKLTQAHKDKVSATRIKKGISPWNKGKKADIKQYDSRRGVKRLPISEETRAKMSSAKKGRDPINRIKIAMVNSNGDIVKTYKSLQDAKIDGYATCARAAKKNKEKIKYKSGGEFWKFI